MKRNFVWTVALALTVWTSQAAAAELKPPQVEFFENNIRPVLAEHCYQCHSAEADEVKSGLRLDTRSGLREGGASGRVLVPGDPDKSRLIQALRHQGPQMPPSGRLPDEVIADFVRWIETGAPDPRGSDAETARQESGAQRWAFRPIERPEVPQVNNAAWPASEIDRFILARLEAEGLEPVADADRRSLIRRVYFDLIGLPPEPNAVEAFVNDPAPTAKALEKVVDELLASPHFGERWGRHWLDVARYAESTGKEWNWAHPQAWRYRDYVIESFNEDKPYDRFLREQIAGDQLPADNWKERDEQLIATGFLVLGPKSVSLGNDERFRLDLADDQINTVSRAVLGLTVGCARCHDHKFDPVPAEDYYALAGVFMSTDLFYGTASKGYKGRNNNQPRDLLPIGPEAEQRQQAVEKHRKELDKLSKQLDKSREELKKLRKQAKQEEKLKAAIARRPDEKRPQERIAELKAEIEKRETRHKQLKNNPPPKPGYAMGVRDGQDPGDIKLRKRGEFNQRGEPVPRERFLTAVSLSDPPPIKENGSGRKALAEWLVHPDNPLTARVLANRVWQHLFGRGLVPTPDNFGKLGRPPSHPQLLDHLAARFREDGWSVKSLIKRIVLSRTYQLGTNYDESNATADPDNSLVWRMSPRRLDAEVIRDALLAIGGRLNPRPLEGSPAVAELGPGWIEKEVKSPEFKNYDHNHRSIYLPVMRGQVPEALATFDFPNPAETTGKRDVTNVPSQALYLMNDEFVVEQSRHAARRLLEADGLSPAGRVDRAYRLALSRPPADEERERAVGAVREMRARLEQTDRKTQAARLDAWAGLFQALFSSGEFLFLF